MTSFSAELFKSVQKHSKKASLTFGRYVAEIMRTEFHE